MMTEPIWMASPPEVHSALLSSGPGPGSLLAAAEAWDSLSAEYASAANELNGAVASVQAGVWAGTSAEAYVAAHAPYLAWLTQASANSAAAATQHETAAAAYAAALSAIPTLAELAANHTVHAVLVATNFFGINTIPITLNEADYVRMWTQAATTMATYQAVSSAAVASTPSTAPAPQILKSTAQSQDSTQPWEGNNLLQQILNALRELPTLYEDVLSGNNPADSGLVTPVDPEWYLLVGIEWFLDAQQVGADLLSNPSALAADFSAGISDVVFDTTQFISTFGPPLQSLSLGLGQAIAGFGALSGLAGVGGLAGLAALPMGTSGAESIPIAAEPQLPAVGLTPTPSTVLNPGAVTATAPATALSPVPAADAGHAAGAPPPPPADSGGFPYLVGNLSTSSVAAAHITTPDAAPRSAPSVAAPAVVRAGPGPAQARGRRAMRRGYGDEFMEMNIEVDPDWGAPPVGEPIMSTMASDQGAGSLGFAGTVHNATVGEAVGLTTLGGDEFGGGPTVPMVPGTWHSDQAEPATVTDHQDAIRGL
jgi:PPE-repeat protein